MTESQIKDLLAIYRKHGWSLQRVLLTEEFNTKLQDVDELFGKTEVRRADINAAWFSRPPRNGQETWELRRLSETGYALNEFLDEDDDAEIREAALAEVEERLREVAK